MKWIGSIIILFFSYHIIGQPSYGDDWVQDNQTYYKFYVEEEGIYRINAATLKGLGIPVEDIPLDQYQIYSYGDQVPLLLPAGDRLDEEEDITFYGQGPDGSIDGLLYTDPARQQLNPTVSLYSTKRPYFLTWTTDTDSSLRINEVSNGLGGTGLPPKEPFYMHREVISYEEFHHKPTHDGRNFIRFSSMDESEGYGSELEPMRSVSIPVAKLSPFGIDPKVVVRMGTNVLSKTWSISNDQRNLKIFSQRGYGVVDIDERFPLEDLSEGTFQLHINALGDQKQKHTLAYVELHYPRLYSFDGETQITWTQQSSIIDRYIELEGFGGSSPLLFNLTERTVMQPEIAGDLVSFVTPFALEDHDWILVDESSSIHEISDISAIDLTASKEVGDYLIISHASLINSGAIASYADYRSSEEGGSYNTTVVDIDELTERYAYGIQGHPLAIKNYMSTLREEGRLPDFIFLIGKGREYTEIKEELDLRSLVPTFGIPGSDNLLVAFDGYKHPERPIGRLAAQTPDEVMNYLAKIKAHEIRGQEEQTPEAQSWKKSVIHLSGGSSANQATLFRYLNDMGEVLSSNQFGANVTTFRKTSADPLERVTTDEIVDRIDEGAALMTFFGHSAVGTFDFSLEDPSVYDNDGRTPVIISLGCHSGNIHTSTGGISEDFVMEESGGAIAFIASSGTAYPEPQYFTGINMYDLLGGDKRGHPIGEVLQNSLEMRTENPSISVQTLIEQLTLHGDPAYSIASFEGPDYIIDNNSVSVSPGIIDINTLQYSLTFDLINLGAAPEDGLVDVRVIHRLPDGTHIDTSMLQVAAPAYNTTVTLDLYNPGVNWLGANHLLIEVDPSDRITEAPSIAEENNVLIGSDGTEGLQFYVFDNSAKPIEPANFSIYTDESISLRAAVNNSLRPSGTFVMQIDTTELFDSPMLTETTLEATNSQIDWEPNIDHEIGRVYYWRLLQVREGGSVVKSDEANIYSFVFDPGSAPGWHQSHYFQWLKDDLYKTVLSTDDRTWSYDDRSWDVRIKNEIRDEGDFWVYVNNTPWASLNPLGKGSLLSIFAWDPIHGIFENSGTDYGSVPFTRDGFIYDMDDDADIEGVLALLDNIPEGSRVFFHTMITTDTASLNIPLWFAASSSGESLVSRLQSYGAQRLDGLAERGTVPYTFVFDKGEGPVVEDIANNIFETIDLTSKASSSWSEGSITSPLIKASGRYLRLMWDEEKEEGDQSMLYVLGVTAGGLRDTVKNVSGDYDVNLTNINPEKYPHIQLVYATSDEAQKTPSQLSYWRVISSTLPDAAIFSRHGEFEFVDSVFAGQDLTLQFDLTNWAEVDMEPVTIKYTLIDEDFQEKIFTKQSPRLESHTMVPISQLVKTDQLSGRYQVVIEVNPGEVVKEVSLCNNLGFTEVYVIPDETIPTLDVTVDGEHIADREIISQHAEFVVKLRDEDSFLLLDDPDDLDIRIFYPQLLEWKADPSSEITQWIPATNIENNEATFILNPRLHQIGIYDLEIRAKDKAGNKVANADPYILSFIVVDQIEPSVLSVSPNPMTNEAIFEYTIDEDRIPSVFALNIYASDGRLVRSISKEDFGGLQAGRNTYRWDGTSSQGAEVPQGIYYYEIVDDQVTKTDRQVGGIVKM